MNTTRSEIIIIGAGIGGLVAALALLQKGFRVQVHEQAPMLGEVGAGFTISTGAQKIMRELGLLEQVHDNSLITTKMPFVHYQSARNLNDQPDRSDELTRDNSMDARHMHRADLHNILANAFQERAPGQLFLNHRLQGVTQKNSRVSAEFANGELASGDLLIGADGVRSTVRALLWGDGAPRFTGQIAYRCLLPIEIAQPYLALGRAAQFIGPRRIFSRYTVRQNKILNCVGIVQSDEWLDDGWSTPATPEEMSAQYVGWHPDVVDLVAKAPRVGLIKWGLFDRPMLKRWTEDRVTLLGDAAHPMLPFLGLGAAMAIEDGIVLAHALDAATVNNETDHTGGFANYEALRHPRVAKVAELSREQGDRIQSIDPDHYDKVSAPASNRALYDFDIPTNIKAG